MEIILVSLPLGIASILSEAFNQLFYLVMHISIVCWLSSLLRYVWCSCGCKVFEAIVCDVRCLFWDCWPFSWPPQAPIIPKIDTQNGCHAQRNGGSLLHTTRYVYLYGSGWSLFLNTVSVVKHSKLLLPLVLSSASSNPYSSPGGNHAPS